MSQNREPPAFMEYPGTIMAQIPYRTMNLSERGLLYSLRLELWINQRLPRDPEKLAKVLGFDAGEVAAALPAVMSFMDEQDGYIVCPELLNYRAHLDNQKERMANGGKRGAALTNGKRKRPEKPAVIDDTTTPATTPQPPRRGASGVLDKSSTVKPSQDLSLKREITTEGDSGINDEWLNAYKAAEGCTADAYASASG